MKRTAICFLFAFMNSSQLFAGWVSGGGSLLKDSRNPFFIQNTKQVTYCIKHDAQNFSASYDSVREATKRAIDFWKDNFAYAKQDEFFFQVGTQDFIEDSTCTQPDLVFQFGLLDEEQKQNIENPTEHVGLTIRTEYDPKTLRGKGFIYIAPDNGPLRIPHPNNKGRFWHDDAIALNMMVIHELGHVFGIQHQLHPVFLNERIGELLLDYHFYNSVLTEKYLDIIENQKFFKSIFSTQGFWMGESKAKQNFLNQFMQGQESLNLDQWKSFWGETHITQNCGSIFLKVGQNSQGVLSGILKTAGTDDLDKCSDNLENLQTVGTITPEVVDSSITSQMVLLYVTEEQTVLERLPGPQRFPRVFGGASKIDYSLIGIYKSVDGSVTRELLINPTGISGFFDGQTILSLMFPASIYKK